MPAFTQGEAALFKFIHSNIVYPPDALRDRKAGKIQVRAVINETGDITDAKVLRGISGSLDAEAVRVIRLTSGMWDAGRLDGKAVKVYKTIPVTFAIDTSPVHVEQSIGFIGGDTAYQRFIKDHIQMPGAIPNHNLWDTVTVVIGFNSYNQIMSAAAVGNKNPELSEEAVRLASLTQGKWIRTPVMMDQGYISTTVTIPFTPDMIKPDHSNVRRESIIYSALYTDSLFYDGYMFYQHHDYVRAVDLLDESLRKDPKQLASMYIRVLCYIKLEKYDQACDDIERLMHIDGLSSDAAELHGRYCTLQKGSVRDEKRKKEIPGYNGLHGTTY
jgi:TonB family protein